MPEGSESYRIAKKGRRTIAKKVGKTPSKFEKYWKSGKEQAGVEEEQVNELAAGGKKPREPYAYAMAVALRRAQRTGSKPHKKLSKESFEKNLDVALDSLSEAGMNCPKCGSTDVLAGTMTMKNHCSSCGENWGDGESPKKVKKEEATTSGGIADVAYGSATGKKKKKKPGNGGGRYIKKNWMQTTHESIDDIANTVSEDISVNNGVIDESYNDNYMRPNQADRRTNTRQADGTQPPGSLEDDIIMEYPDLSEDDYMDAMDAAVPGTEELELKMDILKHEAEKRSIHDKDGLIALAKELFPSTENAIVKNHDILGTIEL